MIWEAKAKGASVEVEIFVGWRVRVLRLDSAAYKTQNNHRLDIEHLELALQQLVWQLHKVSPHFIYSILLFTLYGLYLKGYLRSATGCLYTIHLFPVLSGKKRGSFSGPVPLRCLPQSSTQHFHWPEVGSMATPSCMRVWKMSVFQMAQLHQARFCF